MDGLLKKWHGLSILFLFGSIFRWTMEQLASDAPWGIDEPTPFGAETGTNRYNETQSLHDGVS